MQTNKIINKLGFRTFLLIVLTTYFYVFMEWVFFVTKPSFFSTMNIFLAIKIFFQTSFAFVIPGIIIALLIWGISRLIKKESSENVIVWIGAIVPAIILASLAIILIDNFTYTIFKFGVVSTTGIWRSFYAILFICLFIAFLKKIKGFIQSRKGTSRYFSYSVFFLLLVSILLFFLQFPKLQLANEKSTNESSSVLPNIILLGADGVNADNMSVYGYPRNTTPNITELSQKALVVENAFSNSGNTGGSLTSLLTGKLPTETRVIYPPDILMGEDAYEHLPGLLKQLGYSTVQITMPSFGDAYDRNIKNGFDVANFRSENENPFSKMIDKLSGGEGNYFSEIILQRIADRLQHAFYIKKMDNPYEIVTKPTSPITEEQRFNGLLTYLDDANGPIFIHVHMMGTHGPYFEPQQKIFSNGEKQDQPWMTDFYDDAISDFDKDFKRLFEHLSETGKINNTIIILYSDHGMNWSSRNKVPLIIWFPHNNYAGRVLENAQLIDVAPTILDYLEVSQPAWMHGDSILGGILSSTRNIISVDTAAEVVENIEGKGWIVNEKKALPPFFQLGEINLIVCNKWYSLNLRTPKLTFGNVEGSTTACDKTDIPSSAQVKDLLLQQLSKNGYDISSYPKDVPIEPIITTTPLISNSEIISGKNPSTIEPVATITPTISNTETISTNNSSSIESTTTITPAISNTPSISKNNPTSWKYPTYGWNPLIAHGFGQWKGIDSPDNYEAFLESYTEGFRTFEVDIVMSSDGIPLAAHDRQEAKYGLSGNFTDHTAEEFLAAKLNGVGTTLAGPQIIKLLNDYPDSRIILDVKVQDQASAISWFLERLPESQWPRLLTNIRSEDDIHNLLAKNPTYRGAFLQLAPWKQDLVFTDEQVRDIVTKYNLAGTFTWIDELDYSLDYIDNNIAHRRWTPTLERYMTEAKKAMIWHTSDDPELIALRRNAGGAVITNIVIPDYIQNPSRVLIISVDGLRPEAISLAPMPNLISLMQSGAYTLNAQTINPSLTLPSHASMLTGLCPSKHGVDWNDYLPDRGFAKGTDIFDLAEEADMDTIMLVGKIKLRQITEPESTDIFEFVNDTEEVISLRAAELISQDFDLMFVHFPAPDIIGHQYGWLSPEQLDVLSKTDKAIGKILSAIIAADMSKDTLVIITADHGGHNTTHGTERPDDMTIPWIMVGPGVIPAQLDSSINTTDTAATAAWALDLPIPSEWDGYPVLEAFGLPDDPHPQPRCP
jgi:arylsulfatase A-like enzyme